MKFLKIALVATAVSTFAASAQAQDSNVYINAGVQTLEFETVSLVGRLGYNFSEYFGVEGEGAFGVSESDGIENTYNLGAFLTARYPVSDSFDFFGRLGYEAIRLEDDFDEETFDGFAFGGGLQYNFGDANGVRVGYTGVATAGTVASLLDVSYVRNF